MAETTSFLCVTVSNSPAQSLNHQRNIVNISEIMDGELPLSNTVKEVTFVIGTTVTPLTPLRSWVINMCHHPCGCFVPPHAGVFHYISMSAISSRFICI